MHQRKSSSLEMNAEEAFAVIKSTLNPNDFTYLKDCAIPDDLRNFLYKAILAPFETSLQGDLSYNYVMDIELSIQNWDDLKLKVELYYSPLYRALL